MNFVLIITLIVSLLAAPGTVIYTPDQLCADILENRDGNLIIEIVIGVLLDELGNGQVLNTTSPFNYIAYCGHIAAQPGDIILTILIYNPSTNYVDDISHRFDFKLS
jgi:hypothetical protein